MATAIDYPGCLLKPQLTSDRPRKRHPLCQIRYVRNTWVQLLQTPRRGISARARLLCQESLSTWIAWIPNHGEVVLDRSQFYSC
ncbi:MAG: hypothetical protein AAFO87_06310 [Cyanobacteria bacterium J06607_6]